MIQPETIFRSGFQHTIYVTTEVLELGAILRGLGYAKMDSDTYKNHVMGVRIADVDIIEAKMREREIKFHPQGRLIISRNCNVEGYVRSALRLVATIGQERQWYAIYTDGEPYVHKIDPLEPVRMHDTDLVV